MAEPKNYLGIDVGEKRIGLAIANSLARLPQPLMILPNDSRVYRKINEIVQKEGIEKIIIGLPRNMSGEETAQSLFSRSFAEELSKHTDVAIDFADETLSTKRVAESTYKKDLSGHLDSVAACFILEEYLEAN